MQPESHSLLLSSLKDEHVTHILLQQRPGDNIGFFFRITQCIVAIWYESVLDFQDKLWLKLLFMYYLLLVLRALSTAEIDFSKYKLENMLFKL